jgi:hypothetical protein
MRSNADYMAKNKYLKLSINYSSFFFFFFFFSNSNNNNNSNDSSFSLTDGSADGSVPGSVFGEFELQADDWAHLTESSAVKMFRKGQPIVIAGTPASVLLHITQVRTRKER